jgi:hypothetical protein
LLNTPVQRIGPGRPASGRGQPAVKFWLHDYDIVLELQFSLITIEPIPPQKLELCLGYAGKVA